MKYPVILLCVLMLPGQCARAVGGTAARETLRLAARQSGKEVLSGTAERAAIRTLKQLTARHGDDVLRLVREGGLEMLDALPRHGDNLVRVSRQLSPQGRRMLAMHSDQLMPLAMRSGPQVVELAARNPGVYPQAIRLLGNDSAGRLLMEVPASDLPRLLRYVEAADTPATRDLILQAYRKEGSNLFQRIPPRLVLAGGISAAMIHGTHRVTAPAQELSHAIARAEPAEVMDIAEKHIRVTRDRLSLWILGVSVFTGFLILRALPPRKKADPAIPPKL